MCSYALKKFSKKKIDICCEISKNIICESFGKNFIFEVEKNSEESTVNIEFGIDSKKKLLEIDETLLEISSELSDTIRGEDGLDLDYDDCSVRLLAFDFTNSNYQSYQDGEYDTGHIAGDDGYEDYMNDVKINLSRKERISFQNWIN